MDKLCTSNQPNSAVGWGWLRAWFAALVIIVTAVVAGCASGPGVSPTEVDQLEVSATTPYYQIGPGDQLQVFVWENAELSTSVPVRPDGRINTPLVEDMDAAGKQPTQLASDMEKALSKYIQDPIVTVMVENFVGVFKQQVRVVGEATEPQALQYSDNMSLLDVMIAVGGLTEYAAGDDAKLIRKVDGEMHQQTVRLDELLRNGDISANVMVQPGDILIIPEAWF